MANLISSGKNNETGRYEHRFSDGTVVARTEDAWWAWHDADSSRWSPGEDPDAETADAEKRAAAWVAGQSNDGPDLGEAPAVSHGRLVDYNTTAIIRAATAEEQGASQEQAKRDGGAGVIDVDGRRCYVED